MKTLDITHSTGCVHALNHLSVVDSKGWVGLCCQYDEANEMPNLGTIDTLDGILTSSIVKTRRKQLFAGEKIKNCDMCWYQEKIGMNSRRQKSNMPHHATNFTKIQRGILQDLEIGLDYTCNMMCRMCKPSLSSKWNSAIEVNKEMQTFDSDHHDGQYKYGNYQRDIRRVLENTDLSQLKKLQLVGGEPFYSKNFPWLMEKLRRTVNLSELTLGVSTNGSIIPEESLNVLTKLKELNLAFSLDAIGDLASCIRWGVDFGKIDNIINKWVALRNDHPNINLGIHCTINIQNMNMLNPLIDYATERGFDISTNVLQGPVHLVPYQIPNLERRKFNIKTVRLDNSTYQTKAMRRIVHSTEVAKNNLEAFLKSCDVLDKYQGMKFSDVNPEIYRLAEKYK